MGRGLLHSSGVEWPMRCWCSPRRRCYCSRPAPPAAALLYGAVAPSLAPARSSEMPWRAGPLRLRWRWPGLLRRWLPPCWASPRFPRPPARTVRIRLPLYVAAVVFLLLQSLSVLPAVSPHGCFRWVAGSSPWCWCGGSSRTRSGQQASRAHGVAVPRGLAFLYYRALAFLVERIPSRGPAMPKSLQRCGEEAVFFDGRALGREQHRDREKCEAALRAQNCTVQDTSPPRLLAIAEEAGDELPGRWRTARAPETSPSRWARPPSRAASLPTTTTTSSATARPSAQSTSTCCTACSA